MTIFRYSASFAFACVANAGIAQSFAVEPRSELEAIVLGDISEAQKHLELLAQRGVNERDVIVAELSEAGFKPDRGTRDCSFYDYYRKIDVQGRARSAQVAMCGNGQSMALVMDMLPPSNRGSGMSSIREGTQQ